MNKILEVKFGSHLYGTDTEASDLDVKAVYLPTGKEILLHSYKETINTTRSKKHGERNTKDDVDVEVLSLCQFMKLLSEGQTMAVDMLFASKDCVIQDDYNLLGYLKDHKYEFLSKSISPMIGYARHQAAKYGIKGTRVAAMRLTLEYLNTVDLSKKLLEYDISTFVETVANEHIKITACKGPKGEPEPHLKVCGRKIPFHARGKFAQEVFQKIFDNYGARAILAEKNEGIDWKALSHAVRVNSEGIELLKTHNITFPRPDAQLLLDIKLGKKPYGEVAEIIEQGLVDLEDAQKESTLRDTANKDWVDNYVYNIYKSVIFQEEIK